MGGVEPELAESRSSPSAMESRFTERNAQVSDGASGPFDWHRGGASHPVFVHRLASLIHASFRPRLAAAALTSSRITQ